QIELVAVEDHGNERRDQIVQRRVALDLPGRAEFTVRIAQDEGHGQAPRVALQDRDPVGELPLVEDKVVVQGVTGQLRSELLLRPRAKLRDAELRIRQRPESFDDRVDAHPPGSYT